MACIAEVLTHGDSRTVIHTADSRFLDSKKILCDSHMIHAVDSQIIKKGDAHSGLMDDPLFKSSELWKAVGFMF